MKDRPKAVHAPFSAPRGGLGHNRSREMLNVSTSLALPRERPFLFGTERLLRARVPTEAEHALKLLERDSKFITSRITKSNMNVTVRFSFYCRPNTAAGLNNSIGARTTDFHGRFYGLRNFCCEFACQAVSDSWQ